LFCTVNGSGAYEHHHGGEDAWGNNGDSTSLQELPPTAPSPVPAEWVNGPRQWTDWPGSWGKDAHVASPARPTGRFRTPWQDVLCADDNDGCPIQTKLAAARAKPTTSAQPNVGNCAGWFGGGVVATACEPRTLRTALERRRLGKRGQFGLKVRRKDARSDAAPGVSQAMGRPLQPGDSLVVHGAASRPGELLVRVAMGGRVYTVRFNTMGLTSKRGRAVLRVKRGTIVAAGRRGPNVVLAGANGSSVEPAAVTR
jgi:hypothetical protein